MINIEAFSYALKVTWIRRLITDNCKWQDYILKYVNLEKLTAVDTKYAEEIMKKKNRYSFLERCLNRLY